MLKRTALCTVLATLVACDSKGGAGSPELEGMRDATSESAHVEDDASQSAEDPASVDAMATNAREDMDGGAALAEDAGSTSDARAPDAHAPDASLDASASDAQPEDGGLAANDGAPGDANTPDASPRTSFTLTVRRGPSQPLAQAPVLFHDATGALLSEHVTAADGRVQSSSAPAMVTVIAPKQGNVTATIGEPQLFTITQLGADDAIVLELPAQAPSTPPADRPGYLVSVPASPALPANTASVIVHGGRDSCAVALVQPPTPPYALPWPESCALQQRNSLLAIAFTDTYVPTGYAFGTGFAPFASAPAAVTLNGWTAPENVVVTVRSLPAANRADAQLLLWSEQASFDPIDRGPRALAPGMSTRSLSWPAPRGFADEQSIVVNADGPLARQVSSLGVRGAPSLTPEVDLAAGLPGATGITLDRTTMSRPSLQWTNASSPSNVADGSAVLLEWPTPWLLVTPASASALRLPELPERWRGFLSTSARPAMYVSHFASSRVQDYRAFLREPVRPLLEGSFHLLGRELPSAASIQAVSWSAQ